MAWRRLFTWSGWVGHEHVTPLHTNHPPFSPDLSFNNIEEVGGGLEGLVQLRDLSLAHNLLTDISGFQSLCRLQSLSLASNKLETLEQVWDTTSVC